MPLRWLLFDRVIVTMSELMTMDERVEANRKHWDEAVPIHVASTTYDVANFGKGRGRLRPGELGEVGDVRGKSLLHLQCHFGLDTLSWAMEGARVTGADFSEPAIEAARKLAEEHGIEARFVMSDIYDLPERLDGDFDIVFTSYGALNWLPDVERWAGVAWHFVKPGGTFYIVAFHPVAMLFADPPAVPSQIRPAQRRNRGPDGRRAVRVDHLHQVLHRAEHTGGCLGVDHAHGL